MQEEELKSLYSARLPWLNAFGKWALEKVTTEVYSIISSKEVGYNFFQIPPKHRVKTVESFLEKAVIRKPSKNPFEAIEDQVGIRFVVLLLEDISTVGDAIESIDWNFEKCRDFQSERSANPDYFAYQSDHYVIRNKNDINVESIVIPANTPCEIQIRTILQHAYAEMAHAHSYKPTSDLPSEQLSQIRRSLAKGSALIETTDDVFHEIRNRIATQAEHSEAILKHALQVQKGIISDDPVIHSQLSSQIISNYIELLDSITKEDIDNLLIQKPVLKQAISDLAKSSVLYRDPIILLISALALKHPRNFYNKWQMDHQHLARIYDALGISTIDY